MCSWIWTRTGFRKNKTFGRYAGAFKPDKSRKAFVFTCSCFCMWPGNLINPRQVEYVGEAGLEYQHGKFHGFSFPPPFCPGILLAVSFFVSDGRIFLMDSSNMVLKWDATIEMWLVRMWSSMGMVPSRWSLLVRIEILFENKRNPVATCDGAICSDRFGFFWGSFPEDWARETRPCEWARRFEFCTACCGMFCSGYCQRAKHYNMIRRAFAKSIRSIINCKTCIRYSVFRRGNFEPSLEYVCVSLSVNCAWRLLWLRNIRTCCEYGALHMYVVCRKRNLTCPRVVSWFINQAGSLSFWNFQPPNCLWAGSVCKLSLYLLPDKHR